MSGRRLLRLVPFALAAASAAGAQQPVRWDITVRPETVTVGEPFTVALHVQAPDGATVVFPAGPDSAAAVQQLDPRVVRGGGDGLTATYRLAAWNVGTLALALPDVVLHVAGATQRISLHGATIFVKSVLPADSARRVPKPARDLFTGWAFPWWILAVLAAIAFVAWLTWRRRRGGDAPAPPAVAPFERAEREFTRIAALGLVEAGERGRYVSLMVEVVRDYLQNRFPVVSLSLTTPEAMREVADAPTVPQERLRALLDEADLVKFARRALTTDRAVALGREAREIVVQEHLASNPPAAEEAA